MFEYRFEAYAYYHSNDWDFISASQLSDTLVDGNHSGAFQVGTDHVREPTGALSVYRGYVSIGTERYPVFENGVDGRFVIFSETPAVAWPVGFDFVRDLVTSPFDLDFFPLVGTENADHLEGNIQNDTITGLGGDDTLLGADGVDLIDGGPGHDRIDGGFGSDNLTGAAGDDTLLGGRHNDWITPGPGNDSVDGGLGADMVSFFDMAQAVRVVLSDRLATTGQDSNTLSNVENVTGSIYADFIEGDSGDNFLRGLGGYDWFIGTDGTDRYDGGSGRDMISYVHARSAVTVDLGAGRGLAGMAEGDTYVSVERATGSSHGDTFHGSEGEDIFRGLGGYDLFIGSGGGRDRYDGGTGSDTVAYTASSSAVTANLRLGYGSRGDAARDLYTRIENLTGTGFDDDLRGDHQRNALSGGDGDDFLFGDAGNDTLTGGLGDDTLDGGLGWDRAHYSGNQADYTVRPLDNGDVRVTGTQGADLLIDVEAILFADGQILI
jgi:Ca2+-binding RTX toxin-like protein